MSTGYTRYPAAGSGTGDVVGPGTAADGSIALFDGTTGKLIRAATGSGVVKAVSGVYSAATIVNADVSATAAIVYSKLNLATSIVNADISTSAAIAYSKLALTGTIVNADIATSAAIAYSKLALSGSITNADVATGAAIVYSKLSLAGSIVNADIASGAAIAYSKLALATSIVNADISASAAVAYSKLATMSTGQVLLGNAGTPTATTLSGDITVGATGITAIGAAKVTNAMLAGSIDLTTKVTGSLPVGNGGTGTNTLTANSLVVGNGSSAVAFVAPSTARNELRSNGTTWASTAPVVAVASTAAGQSINNATTTIVNYGTVVKDNYSAITTGASWKFTAPFAGDFKVEAAIRYNTASFGAGNSTSCKIFVNGALYRIIGISTTYSAYTGYPDETGGSTTVTLALNDTLDIRTDHGESTARTLEPSAFTNWVCITSV